METLVNPKSGCEKLYLTGEYPKKEIKEREGEKTGKTGYEMVGKATTSEKGEKEREK